MSIEDRYVQVTTRREPSVKPLREFGDILILGCTDPAPSRLVYKYSDMQQVLEHLYADSEEAMAAAKIFAQYPATPGILIGQIGNEAAIDAYREILATTQDFDIIYLAGYRVVDGEGFGVRELYEALKEAEDADTLFKEKRFITTLRDPNLNILNNQGASDAGYFMGDSKVGCFYQYPDSYPYESDFDGIIRLGKDEQPGAAFLSEYLGADLGKNTATFTAVNGVTPIRDLSPAQEKNLFDKNLNYYGTVGSKNGFVGGKMMDGRPINLAFEELAVGRIVKNTILTRLVSPKKKRHNGEGLAMILAMVQEGFEICKSRGMIESYEIVMPELKDITAQDRLNETIPPIKTRAEFSTGITKVTTEIMFFVGDGGQVDLAYI